MTGSALCTKRTFMRVIFGVAGGAVHGRAFEDIVFMTTLTGSRGMFAIQMEGKFRMIYCGRFPAIRRMTGCTECTKLTGVRIILGVAGGAVLWRTFEYAINMTTLTGDGGMFAVQMERKFRMIYRCGFPTAGCMTSSAQGTKSAFMRVIFGMAGGTILWRAFEDAIDMATLTSDSRMFPVKFERELGMVHFGEVPAFGRVTCCAVSSKLTVVMVIFLVTGDTRLGSGFHVSEAARVDMAGRTFHRCVFADQVERHFVMVEGLSM